MTAKPDASAVHATLVLVRHGESVWNRSQRLTGWADVGLSDRGRAQARRAGVDLRARGVAVDACYCSQLRRSSETLDLLLDALGATPPRQASWRLNERHYGALQGLPWWRAMWRFGPAAVWRCKRDFAARPPQVPAPRLPDTAAGVDAADAEEWRRAQCGESIDDAVRRFLPFWSSDIAPALRAGACVLVVGHNNLLRGLVAHLEGGGEPPLAFAMARPRVLELDPELRVVRSE